MKKTIINFVAISTLMLVATEASAQNYPAADFQPKILYRSEAAELAAAAASNTAAPCQPAKAAFSAKEQQTEFDAKYPAASFQPKVIYSSNGS